MPRIFADNLVEDNLFIDEAESQSDRGLPTHPPPPKDSQTLRASPFQTKARPLKAAQTANRAQSKRVQQHKKSVVRKTARKQPPAKTARKQPITKPRGRQKAIARKSAPTRRKHRYKPGTVALREIRRAQKSTELLIPRIPFQRLVREIMSQVSRIGATFRIQGTALSALQEATEAFLIREFELSQLAALHRSRITLLVKDMRLVQKIVRVLAGEPGSKIN